MRDLSVTLDGLAPDRIVVLIHDRRSDLTVTVDLSRRMDCNQLIRAYDLLENTGAIVHRALAEMVAQYRAEQS